MPAEAALVDGQVDLHRIEGVAPEAGMDDEVGMISLFAKPAIASLMLIAAGPQLPQLDVQRLCMDTAGGDGVQKCVTDELYAKQKLLKYWSRTPLAYKKQCLLDPLPPDPSYLVLRDCINNNVILKQHKAQSLN